MAEISKYKSSAVGRLLQHNNRTSSDGVTHSNEDIDILRTDLNYHLKEGSPSTWRERMSHLYHLDRENLVSLAEIIVTLPRDVRREDEKKFFEGCYDFVCDDWGEKNIINAVVHKDEATPHIHIDFIPAHPFNRDELSQTMQSRIAMFEKTTGNIAEGIVNARDTLNRTYFQKFHPRLLSFMTERIGYSCEILNGATAGGNRTVLQMKNQMLEREVGLKQEQLNSLDKSVNFLLKQIENTGIDKNYFSSMEIIMRLAAVTRERDMLRQIVAEHGIILPSEEAQHILENNRMFKDTHFTITYADIEKRNDGIIVLETYKDIRRIPPMRAFIEANPFLEEEVNKNPKDLTILQEPFTDKTYILFPTDNMDDTFHNFIRLKDIGRRLARKSGEDKVVFPQISNDTFNIGETILRQCYFETEYHMRENNQSMERTQVRSRLDG